MHNLKSNREPTNALRLLASSVLDQRQRPPMNQNAGREEMRTYVLPTATGASCKAGGKQQSAPAPRAQMHLHTQRTDALVRGSRLASSQKKPSKAPQKPQKAFSAARRHRSRGGKEKRRRSAYNARYPFIRPFCANKRARKAESPLLGACLPSKATRPQKRALLAPFLYG